VQIDFLVTALARMNFRMVQWLITRNAMSVGAEYVNLSYPFVSKGFVKRLHKHGFKVNVWVVNTPALMKKMIRYRVDGIITDYPGKLKKFTAKKFPARKKLKLPSFNGKIRLPRLRLKRR
jgi:glycerophosphoryl diester phosphodiesterase